MCPNVQMLRALVNQRLALAVEEIFVVLERTIAEYEEELCRTKEENERQRQLLDAVSKRYQVGLHGTDITEGLPSEQQEWSSRMEEEEPRPPHIKEEEEDHSISQEGEHLEGSEEFPVIGVPVKSEDDEDDEGEETREAEPPMSSSTQHMTTEADGDHCGGSAADKLLAPLSDSEHTTSHSPHTDDEDDEDSTADMTCHPDNTRFKCDHCDKTFAHKKSMNRHLRTSLGEKAFPCSVCGKRFTQRSHLKRHAMLHLEEKPFAMSVCGEGFVPDGSLTNVYSCFVCGLGFKQIDHLHVHMRTHTVEKPFSCSVCGAGVATKYDLKIHMTKHTGVKPYSCSVCSMSFALKRTLTRHMKKHTGEKPHSCSVCGMCFTQRSNLKRHVERHTGEKVAACVLKDSPLGTTLATTHVPGRTAAGSDAAPLPAGENSSRK